jgi:hypothetical protein
LAFSIQCKNTNYLLPSLESAAQKQRFIKSPGSFSRHKTGNAIKQRPTKRQSSREAKLAAALEQGSSKLKWESFNNKILTQGSPNS